MVPQERIRTPNMTLMPEQQEQPNAGMQFIDTLVSQRAADSTIRSGLPPERQVAAAAQNKHDIVTGKQQPGFFDGVISTIQNIGGNVSQFSQTEAGKQLLQIIGGAVGGAVGGNVGGGNIGGSAGAILGGGQGVAAIQRDEALALENKKLGLETLKTVGAMKGSKGDNAKLERDLRKDFEDSPVIKDFGTVLNNVSNINEAISMLDSGASPSRIATDSTIITSFNKVLDPTSVVRESEYNRIVDSLGYQNRIKGWKDKINKGGSGLTSQDLKDIQTLSNSLLAKRKELVDQEVRRNTEIASSAGVNPRNVVRDFSEQYASAGGVQPTSYAKAGVGDTAMADDRTGQARAWAKANPNDPRAKKILAKLGG